MNEQISKRTRQDIEAHITAQAWRDEAYKQELFSNTKAVIEREFNVQLPAKTNVQVLEENSTNIYFVLPVRPNSSQELTEEQLETVAGGDLNIPGFSEIYNAGKDFGDTIYDALH